MDHSIAYPLFPNPEQIGITGLDMGNKKSFVALNIER